MITMLAALLTAAVLQDQPKPESEHAETDLAIVYRDFDQRLIFAIDAKGRVQLVVSEADDIQPKVYEAESLEAFKKKYPEVSAQYGVDQLSQKSIRQLEDAIAEHHELMRRMHRPAAKARRETPKERQLGVLVMPTSKVLRSHLGLEEGQGVVVIEVMKDGLAARSGIQEYDILVKLDDRPIEFMKPFLTALDEKLSSGKEIKIELIRAGKRQTVTIKPEPAKKTEQ